MKPPAFRVPSCSGVPAAETGRGGGFPLSASSLISSDKLWIVAVVALTLVLFGPSLNDWFMTDDFIFLRAARFASPLTYVRDALDFTGYGRHQSTLAVLRDTDIALPFLAYRPLYFLSLEAQYLVFGENPVGYHVVSLIVHLSNVFLVWAIASRLLQSRLAARMAATIFALHPAYVVAVSWISDIATPLATFMALLSFLLFLKATDASPTHRGWHVASILCFGASTLFHQETISWAAAFVAFHFLVRHRQRREVLQPAAWGVLAPYLAVVAGSLGLNAWIVSHTPVHSGEYTIGPHMLLQFKNFASAALFAVTSGNLTAHFVAFVGLLIMVATLPLLSRAVRKSLWQPRTEVFVVVWFFASLFPLLTLNKFFGIGELNRKLYSAGPALAILLVMYGASLLNLAPMRLQVPVRALAAALVPLALVGVMAQARQNDQQVSAPAVESERFVQALRETYPSLPQGSTLYVVGAPRVMAGFAFGEIYLVGSVQAFYGKVDPYAVSEQEAAALEKSLDEGEYIFSYKAASQ